MDAVALAEQEALHARVPAARLVSEVDAGFEQVLDGQLVALDVRAHAGGVNGSCRRGLRVGRGLGHGNLLRGCASVPGCASPTR